MPATSSKEPGEQVAEKHDMVSGIHQRVCGVAVPQLPDGCCALADHIAPAGILLARDEGAGDVRASVGGERSQEPLPADEPPCQAPAGPDS